MCTTRFIALAAIVISGLAATSAAQQPSVNQSYKQSSGKVTGKSGTDFMREVIRRLGVDGRACSKAGDEIYCFSRTDRDPKAITADGITQSDRLRFQKGVFLCAETGGSLRSCIPTTAGLWGCNHAVGKCWCTGVDSCSLLAATICENGSCGDCEEGDCCCDIPSGD
jgi:hypothetical protein